jgi:hypothetical protein
MADMNLIEAVRNGDLDALRRALAAGGDIHERDEHGWTPLNWAAANNDVRIVRFLLERGADVTLTGRDQRTPLLIARAANRAEAVEILKEAEQKRGIWKDPRADQPYCRAYRFGELRAFEKFGELTRSDVSFTDDSIVYLHHDFIVTASVWHDENIIVKQTTPQWREFCETKLGFAIPDDVL